MALIKTQLGWIEVICGSMFSGKSEELIRRLRRAIIAKQRVQIFKPAIDARYSEAGPDYLYNVTRLLEKFETAKELVPQPVVRKATRETRFGIIYYGSTSPAMAEAFDTLQADGVHVDTLRVRAFPFSAAVDRFIAEHETVFVVEQNRDAQLRMMLVNEQEIDPAKLEPILHYDGTPITARFIIEAIAARVRADNVEPIAKIAKKGLAA